jgi:hypothetical protein
MSDVEGRADGDKTQEGDGAVPEYPQSGVASTPLVGQFTSAELKLDISLIEWTFVSFFPVLVFMMIFVVGWCGLRLGDLGRGRGRNACVMIVLMHIKYFVDNR